MDLGLRGRVYIVTGGSRGLGRAAAQALVDDGARVVVSSRSQQSLDATVDAFGASRVVAVAGENADPELPGRLVAAARGSFGRLDGVLISVGGPPAGQVSEISDETWRQSFETILLGGLRLARTVADALDDGGAVGFVLSSSVRQPIPNLGVSNVLRPGLAMAAKSLADEWGPRGIRVFGLLPGRVDTERVRELDAASGDADAVKAEHLRSIPLRRYGRPEEFGAVAAFLLSPAASYLTGLMVAVDGGIVRSI